jgi:hypothetical protein
VRIVTQALDCLAYPPPLALLETIGVAPGAILLGKGHLFCPVGVLNQHRRRQCVDLCARNEEGPNAAFPELP